MRRIIYVLILLPALCFAQVQKVEIEISKSDSIIHLPHRFIVPSTEILIIDTLTLLQGIHYQIYYEVGKVYLKNSIISKIDSSNFKLKAIYKTIPIDTLFFKYRWIEFLELSQPEEKVLKIEKREEPLSFSGNIQRNGSIVRGFTFGSNRDLTLQSGFNLQLSGNLTKDVEIIASLTDENIPIQPEGNTQTLQEIDKIFIQMKSKNLFATFGDYDIGYQLSDEHRLYFSEEPEFSNVRRRLQGGKFQANYQFDFLKTKNTFAVASSRGKFATNYFNGIDGVQGPYRLVGQNGERDIIVIAGTEKVYIDGELMLRGESNDYIIDYSTAEITFTPNRLITSASRITVDFQYTDRKYARNFLAFTSDNLFLQDRLNLSISYFYDSDNKRSPIDIVLSQSDIEILRSSGDDRLKAVKSGIIYVGFDSVKGIGKGQYVKKDTIIDSQRYEFFVYAPGDKNAFYSISFSYVGIGKGDYVRRGIGKYEFVGKGKGDYLPIIFLPMPQSSQLLDIRTRYQTKNFNFFVESAISSFDKNQFSTIDDRDNKGLALKYGLGYSSGKIFEKGLRKIELNIYQRHKNKNFNALDRFDVVEFNRKWNITDETSQLDESIFESDIQIEIFEKSSVGLGYGLLKNENRFKTNRGLFSFRSNENNLPEIENTTEILTSKFDTSKSKWIRSKGLGKYKIWLLTPFINYETELRENLINDNLQSTGSFRFLRLIPGVEINFKKIKSSLSYEIRFDDIVRNGTYTRLSVMRNQNYNLNINAERFEFNGDLTLNRRTYLVDSIKSINNVLIRTQSRAEILKRAVRINLIYRAMTRMISQLEPVFIKVQRGTGNYRYLGDLNRNGIQDPSEFEQTKFDGDYIMLTLPGDQLIPTANVDASFNLKFYPERLIKFLSPFSSDTYFQVSENSTESQEKIYLLKLKYFQRENKTISGTLTFRHDLHLFENSRKFSLRYRFLSTGSMFSYNISTRKVSGSENSLRIRWHPETELGFQVEGLIKKRTSTGGFKESDIFDIRGKSLSLEIFYKPFNYIELSFKTGIAQNRDKTIRDKVANLNREGVKVSWLLMSKGRMDFEIERNEVLIKGMDVNVPYELVEGNYLGRSVFLRLSFYYNVGDYIQINGNYIGRFLSTGTIHIAQAEVRVYF
ncbi:MAG: hypothetical protein ABDI07_06670 [Candidatus Kryptonium sp.]